MSHRTPGRTTGGASRIPPEGDAQPSATAPRPAARPARSRNAAPDAAHAAARPASRGQRAAPGTPPAGATPPAEAVAPLLDPSTLARTLRAVADELDRDPELASRVAAASGLAGVPTTARSAGQNERGAAPPALDAAPPSPRAARTFRPRLVTGTAAELGTGIPDPFALRARLGRAGLEAALAELRLGTLRAIIREHGLDPARRLVQQNDAERLRAAILGATDRD